MLSCAHCDEGAAIVLYSDDDPQKVRPFCCNGCLTVYHIIQNKGLGAYYDIKKLSATYKRRSPVELKSSQFLFLDDQEFLTEYSYLNSYQEKTMEFYLEGIHCLACLWLIEKLPDFVPNTLSSKLDIERSVVTVMMSGEGKFSDVARELNHLGYRPHPLKKNQSSADFKIKEERSALMRIGIAGAATGNIMIYAVSLYGGASGEFAQLFNLLTVLFAIPVLTYSAAPFYITAWNALKNKTLSIDIPISMSLIMGGIMGIYNLVMGIPDNYFDSLTALVFLLLLSRYFLEKIQEKGLSAQDLHYFYQGESALKSMNLEHSEFKEIHPRFIKVGDVIKVRAGDFIVADGQVIRGSSNVNNSLLTGESHPVKVSVGDKIFSGTQNLDHELIVLSEKVQDETRLGSILKNVENGWAHKAPIIDLTNRISKYFILTVFALSVILFIYLFSHGETRHAIEQSLTLLIVTCPCALALATPLTFTRALSKASELGIIIKNDDVIEKLSNIKNIFVDKTGTITFGKLKITNFKVTDTCALHLESVIVALESRSRHPVALALVEFMKVKSKEVYVVNDYKELLGQGVFGEIQGHKYEIRKKQVFEDGRLVASFEFSDIVRGDSKSAVKNLVDRGYDLKILSGDSAQYVGEIAQQVGLNSSRAMSGLSPEDKSEMIKKTPHSIMIGDGANDAIALTHADVGVAVLGAMDISLRAADVYLSTPGLAPVAKLMTISQETMKVIYRNLFLSLLYNSASVVAVFLGIINPLVAAIIMPLSSLTVLISTVIGTKKLRAVWK